MEPIPNFFSENIEELRSNVRKLYAEKRSLLIRLHREEVPHETIADHVAGLQGEIALLKEENKQLRSELEQVKKTLAKTVKELGEVKDKLHLWEHTVFVRQAVKAFEKRVCFLINYDC